MVYKCKAYHIHSTVHKKETFNKWPLNKWVPSLIHAGLSIEIPFFLFRWSAYNQFSEKGLNGTHENRLLKVTENSI